MKQTFRKSAIVLALVFATSGARAEEFQTVWDQLAVLMAAANGSGPERENQFLILVTTTHIATAKCGVKIKGDRLRRIADMMGVTHDRVTKAIYAAIRANGDMPYERSDLIPAVTQGTIKTLNVTGIAMKADETKTCAVLIDTLHGIGTVE